MNLSLRIAALLFVLASTATDSSAQARPGSIYDPSAAPIRLGVVNTARRPGDLVTVLIVEDQQVRNEETSNLQKTTGLDYALNDFNLAPDAFGSTLPSIGGDRSDIFNGTANYEKDAEFTSRLTAIVVDVLPNDNLVIQGRREIRVDQEIKVIEISGIVRRFDVRQDNTILSQSVADARISYSGTGPLTRTTNRTGLGAWIHRALDWIWPF